MKPLSSSNVGYICTACLGSIQYADSFVDDVCQKLEKEDYKIDSVCLTCTLPVSILPRDHLLKVHVKNILTEESQTDLVRIWSDLNVRDPKDFFKYIFGIKLKQKTGLLLDSNAPLRMTVVIGHEPSVKEHLFLAELKEPLLNIKTVRQKVISLL
jgi:tRNA pseudouridine synthase 10